MDNIGYTLGAIASMLGGELIGDASIKIHRLASLARAREGEITFVSHPRYLPQLAQSGASAVILDRACSAATELPKIVVDNPYAYFARLSGLINPPPAHTSGRHDTAVIDDGALIADGCSIAAHAVVDRGVRLAEGVVIGPGAVIGSGVIVGKNSRIAANVVVYPDCVIGSNCIVAAGTVIGADGFGYAEENDRWVKIPQIGRVVVEDDVEIGANTTIDRGTLDDTVIEQGVKLDNLIQIGHNCRIGAHTVIAGCVGIAGSARIGRHCRIGGAAMILGHLEIADGVTISPGSMITRSLSKTDTYTALMPFQTHNQWLKTAASIRHLGALSERVKQLEKTIALLSDARQDNKD